VLGSEPLSASREPKSWSWISPDGKEVRGDETELVSGLHKGALPPATLVWQKGWTEWLEAGAVAGLASAFPTPRTTPFIEPKRSPVAIAPPPRPRAESPKLPGPLTVPSSFGTLGRPRGPSLLGPPRAEVATHTAPPRAPMATLGDEPGQQRATLRPPGAIPPPPRQIPTPNFDLTPSRLRDDAEAQTRRQNPAPSAMKDTAPDPRGPVPASALPSELRAAVLLPASLAPVEIKAPKVAPLPKPPVPDLDETLGSTPFEVTAQDFVDLVPASTTLESSTALTGPDAKTQPPARRRSSRPAKPSSRLRVVGAAVGVGLATFVVVKLLSRPRDVPANPRTLARSAEPAPPTTPAPAGCGIVQPAARLATSVYRPVAPLVTSAAEGMRASVGFASSETEASGLTIDLVTLDAEHVFHEAAKKPVRFVVPTALDPKRFFVDRDDERTPAARSFDAEPRFALGPSEGDWVRTAGKLTGVVWSGQAGEKTTDPHVASNAAGHLVTFRRGGLSGKVLYGLLGPDGSARGELHTVEAPDMRLVGTPDAALSGNHFLVAFAARATPEEEWHVVLASGNTDGGAPVVRAFATPPGGAGGSSIAPSVSGLGDGGFVLQWTEGKTAEYQVRVQRLGKDLEPSGEPTLVSPKGANAGQGAVFARAPRALALFVQTTAGHDELWGTSLECP